MNMASKEARVLAYALGTIQVRLSVLIEHPTYTEYNRGRVDALTDITRDIVSFIKAQGGGLE